MSPDQNGPPIAQQPRPRALTSRPLRPRGRVVAVVMPAILPREEVTTRLRLTAPRESIRSARPTTPTRWTSTPSSPTPSASPGSRVHPWASRAGTCGQRDRWAAADVSRSVLGRDRRAVVPGVVGPDVPRCRRVEAGHRAVGRAHVVGAALEHVAGVDDVRGGVLHASATVRAERRSCVRAQEVVLDQRRRERTEVRDEVDTPVHPPPETFTGASHTTVLWTKSAHRPVMLPLAVDPRVAQRAERRVLLALEAVVPAVDIRAEDGDVAAGDRSQVTVGCVQFSTSAATSWTVVDTVPRLRGIELPEPVRLPAEARTIVRDPADRRTAAGVISLRCS